MIITRTPLRVSFFGGGTDFPEFFSEHGGAVLGTAIDKYIYHTVSEIPDWLFEHKIRFSYRVVELVNSVDQIKHAPFREILRYCGFERGVEVNLASDLPSFSGLGSSSSFTVGLLKGLHAFKGKHINQCDLAKTAIHVERNILGECVGCQDQVFAAYGGFNLIRFHSESNFEVERITLKPERLEELENSLMLFFTGIRRKAQDIEKSKLSNLEDNKIRLSRMHRLVDEAHSILTSTSSLAAFGELLNATWHDKRQLSLGVSNNEIDTLYETAINAGALGGKLLGAGGGGFVLLFVPPDRKSKVRIALKSYNEVRFNIRSSGSAVIHS